MTIRLWRKRSRDMPASLRQNSGYKVELGAFRDRARPWSRRRMAGNGSDHYDLSPNAKERQDGGCAGPKRRHKKGHRGELHDDSGTPACPFG